MERMPNAATWIIMFICDDCGRQSGVRLSVLAFVPKPASPTSSPSARLEVFCCRGVRGRYCPDAPRYPLRATVLGTAVSPGQRAPPQALRQGLGCLVAAGCVDGIALTDVVILPKWRPHFFEHWDWQFLFGAPAGRRPSGHPPTGNIRDTR